MTVEVCCVSRIGGGEGGNGCDNKLEGDGGGIHCFWDSSHFPPLTQGLTFALSRVRREAEELTFTCINGDVWVQRYVPVPLPSTILSRAGLFPFPL